MSMTDEQKGVAKRAAAAMAITLAGLACAIVLLGPKSAGISLAGRFVLCASCLLAPALTPPPLHLPILLGIAVITGLLGRDMVRWSLCSTTC